MLYNTTVSLITITVEQLKLVSESGVYQGIWHASFRLTHRKHDCTWNLGDELICLLVRMVKLLGVRTQALQVVGCCATGCFCNDRASPCTAWLVASLLDRCKQPTGGYSFQCPAQQRNWGSTADVLNPSHASWCPAAQYMLSTTNRCAVRSSILLLHRMCHDPTTTWWPARDFKQTNHSSV